MDSKDYIYTKMHDTFNDIYKVVSDNKPPNNNDIKKPIEKFNTLDKNEIDNKITEYIYTLRQSRPV